MARRDILNSSKKLKTKRKNLKIVFVVLAVVFLLVGLVYLFRMDQIRIKEVSVDSENLILRDQVKKEVEEMIGSYYLKVLPKNSFFFVPEENIKSKILTDFPKVKSVVLEKTFPNKISISFDERKQEALLCYGKNCGFLDKSGFVFEKAPYFSGDSYLKFFDEISSSTDKTLAIGKNVIEAAKFEKIINFIDLSNKGGVLITKVYLKEGDFYKLVTKEGWSIFINDNVDTAVAFDNLMLGLKGTIKDKRKNLDYIDLRFGSKVPFKFK